MLFTKGDFKIAGMLMSLSEHIFHFPEFPPGGHDQKRPPPPVHHGGPDPGSYQYMLEDLDPLATRSLFVGNIPKHITVYELRDAFLRYGNVLVRNTSMSCRYMGGLGLVCELKTTSACFLE